MNSCTIEGCDKPQRGRGWCTAHYTRWCRHGDPTGGGTSRGAPMEWLHQHVDHRGDDCLIWPFAKTYPPGYAQIRHNGKNRIATRVLCELVHGTPPSPDHEAAHSCGQGRIGCINPLHLRWATPSENEADKLIHGTHNRGERCGIAKLTAWQALEIKRSTKKQEMALAQRFGVSRATVRHARVGDSWAWLGDEAAKSADAA